MCSTSNGGWQSEKNIIIEKNMHIFSRNIPYLLQLVAAQDRSDMIFFLHFLFCFAVYYKLSQLQKSKLTWLEPCQKVMHHRHPEACHWPGETAKHKTTLVGFWRFFYFKTIRQPSSNLLKENSKHKDVDEIVS